MVALDANLVLVIALFCLNGISASMAIAGMTIEACIEEERKKRFRGRLFDDDDVDELQLTCHFDS